MSSSDTISCSFDILPNVFSGLKNIEIMSISARLVYIEYKKHNFLGSDLFIVLDLNRVMLCQV